MKQMKDYNKKSTKGFFSLLFGLTCTMMAACVDEMEPQQTGTFLSLNVQTAAIESRGLIESATLPDGHSIGLTLVDASETTYDGRLYQNVKATASTGKTPQEWTFDNQMLLSATKGTLYAYYPHNSDITDITQIPVVAGETDYMYATPVESINDTKHEAKVTMQHALAAIRLKIVRGTYYGTGEISSVSVQGDGIANTGILNAINGELSSVEGAGTAIVNDNTFTLSTIAQVKDFIFIPVSGTLAIPSFFVTVDGKQYEASASALTFERGIVYEYTLTVNSKEMTLSDVTIGDWGYNQSGNPVIDCGYKITLAGDIYNFAFSNTVYPNGRVDIVVVSLEDDGKYIDDISCSEGCTFTKSLDEKGYLNIVLSEISKDITITFNGKSEYIDFDIAPNGVYAVAQNGKGLAVENADENCIAVALIVNDAAVPQRIMIEKTENYDISSKTFAWGSRYDDISLKNLTSNDGYLPSINGDYYVSSGTKLTADYRKYTNANYCLGDYNGSSNTNIIINEDASGFGWYTNTFNEQGNTNNAGYSDWYVPAGGQLGLMFFYKTAINETLTKIAGTNISEKAYWSSSEENNTGGTNGKAHYINFSNGYVSVASKANKYNIRLIRNIE